MSESTAGKELVALLGEGAEFDGKLTFEGRVRIDGHFRGSILSAGTLVVGERAELEATISVGTLIVLGGIVRGDVRAQQMVELHAPARVFGNITAPQLVVDRGVVFEGRSRVADDSEAPPPARTDGASRAHGSPATAGEDPSPPTSD